MRTGVELCVVHATSVVARVLTEWGRLASVMPDFGAQVEG
jgi:hypothetical protein